MLKVWIGLTNNRRYQLLLKTFYLSALLFLGTQPSLAIVVNDDGTIPCGQDGICNLGGCEEDPDCPAVPDVVALSVSRFTTTTLDNSTADAILAEASNILQSDNGPSDVSCQIIFTRSNNVTAFANGDGSIDSQAEFNTVIGLPGFVKAVNQINWCRGFKSNVIGCSPTPGSSMTVVRFTPLHQEGILWAHEYGHTQGLPHRSGNVVMNGTIGPKNTRVNSNECTAFRL